MKLPSLLAALAVLFVAIGAPAQVVRPPMVPAPPHYYAGMPPARAIRAAPVASAPVRPPVPPQAHVAPPALAAIPRAAAQVARWGTTSEALQTALVERAENNARHGVMGSQIVTLRLQNGHAVRVVFKPVAGEKDWGQYRKGTLYAREIAASRLSDEMGFNLVPPTVPLTINGQLGSAQLFVEGAPIASSVDTRFVDPVQREALTVFDYLIVNGDRHGANWLVRTNGARQEPVAIDHGLSFPSAPNAGNLPRVTSPQVRDLVIGANLPRVARALCEAGLDDAAVKGVLVRAQTLRASLGGPPPEPDNQLNAWIMAARARPW